MANSIKAPVTIIRNQVKAPVTLARDAYQLAVLEGFVGTREEWLASLQGGGGSAVIFSSTPPPNPTVGQQWLCTLNNQTYSWDGTYWFGGIYAILVEIVQITITFDSNGGIIASPATKEVSAGSPYGALAITSRGGYSFNGWFTASSGGTLVISSTVVTNPSDHAIYAQWSESTYTGTVVKTSLGSIAKTSLGSIPKLS